MSDLAAFLKARLHEDEAEASGFAGPPSLLERQRREVKAKRLILDEHAPSPDPEPNCGVCQAGTWDWEPERWPCPTVRMLAAIYSNHSDYCEEWRP